MADVGDRLGRTRWLWVVIAVGAVALLVWWVASESEDRERPGSGQQITAADQANRPVSEDQRRPLGQQQGEVSEEGMGERGQPREYGQDVMPERLDQYVQWVEQQPQDRPVDAAFVVRGMDLLAGAVDDTVSQARQFSERPTEGQPRGGGPTGGALDSPEFERHYQSVQRSTEQLGQVEQARRPALFRRAATDVAALLGDVQQRSEAAGVEPEVDRLQQIAQAIRPDQRLEEQSELVQNFFAQSARVTTQLAKRYQPGPAGTTSPVQDQ